MKARITDSTMLDFVAEFVTQINSLPCDRGERVEVLASDEDDCICITRRGKTTIEAFRKCLKAAMQEMPNRG